MTLDHIDYLGWSKKYQSFYVDWYGLKQLWAKKHAIYRISRSDPSKATRFAKYIFPINYINWDLFNLLYNIDKIEKDI